MPDAAPLEPAQITIQAVQFVGTNVEMTYLVDAPAEEAEARLDALLAKRLGLYAETPTGQVDGPDGRPHQRFSVIASPLDRLFHKIGPQVPLTVIKHASVTLDLSDTNLARQAEGLLRIYPGDASSDDDDSAEIWTPWDVGKLLGSCLRTPTWLERGALTVAGTPVERAEFPSAILPSLEAHAAEHGGVKVVMDPAVRAAMTD